MSPIAGFALGATLLLIAVLAILLPPLLRPFRPQRAVSQREANLAIFRQELRELENEYQEGTLAEAEFGQASSELKRRLLDETDIDTPSHPTSTPPERNTALALLIALPLTACSAYLILGNPQALKPQQAEANISNEQIDAMLNKLVAKLKRQPGDHQGWLMLARSYKVLGRYAESAEAYSHGGDLIETNASLLADYAEVLARAKGGDLAGKPTELLAQALAIDPDEAQALFLAGAAAADRQDFSAAVKYWERLLPQLEPGSEDAQALEKAIEDARTARRKNPHSPTSKP